MEFLVGMRKAIEIMRRAKIRLDVAPQIGFQFGDATATAGLKRLVDDVARCHCERAMLSTQTLCEALKHLMVRAAFARRVDQFSAH